MIKYLSAAGGRGRGADELMRHVEDDVLHVEHHQRGDVHRQRRQMVGVILSPLPETSLASKPLLRPSRVLFVGNLYCQKPLLPETSIASNLHCQKPLCVEASFTCCFSMPETSIKAHRRRSLEGRVY